MNLTTKLADISRISPDHNTGLDRLHLHTRQDLLYHLPTRYADMREVVETGHLVEGQMVTTYGVMEKVYRF